MYHQHLKPFPDNFLWGASTSAYQLEGAYNSDGKGLSVMDMGHHPEGVADFEITSDHYHRYAEDVRLMKEMGLKAYRFSIAWSRVIPSGDGAINPEGLAFYRNLITELRAAQIEPIVTLYHFDLPYALQQKGGWSNRETIDAFVSYAEILFNEFGALINYWLTINEQNIMILHGSALGIVAGESDNLWRDIYQQNHHMLLAQARIMRLCHQLLPTAKIGPAPNIVAIYPQSCKPEDVLAADNFAAIRNWLYLDMAVHGRYNPTAWAYLEEKGYAPIIAAGDLEILSNSEPDFIAFNYYMSSTVAASLGDGQDKSDVGDKHLAIGEDGVFRGGGNPHLAKSSFGWEIDPIGFRTTLRQIYERYHLPLLVTENGLGSNDQLTEDGKIHDNERINYLAAHLEQLQLALSDGVDVFGYCPWSAIDLVSTHQGFTKRYGFIYVNRGELDLKDLARYPKDSFYWYQRVIATNGANLSV